MGQHRDICSSPTKVIALRAAGPAHARRHTVFMPGQLKTALSMGGALRSAGELAPPLLDVSGLTVNFGPVRALRAIDFTIEAGELIALAGEPGAGKTALVRCAAGDLAPASGAIRVLVLVAWTWLLSRTRLGRYIYAIGGNPEGARRAGINVARIRTAGFALCSMTAGIAGLVYESRLGSMSTSVQGGNLVLYAVAAAVIGGTSLFGGRGRPLHALLGGFIIATVFNGLGLMGVSDAVQFIATAIVLIAAVTLDSLVRRRAAVT